MRKRLLLFCAVLCLTLLISMCTYLPVAEAIAPLIILGIGLLIGAIAGAVTSYYITTNYQKVALLSGFGSSYVSGVASEYTNLLTANTQEYVNEKSLIEKTVYYLSRKAEYAAQYYVNESSFPYSSVFATSGLATEYSNLVANLTQQIGNVFNVARGYATTTFTGDLADYTVSGVYQPTSTSFTLAEYNLKSYQLALYYGSLEVWNNANDPTALTWTKGSDTTIGTDQISFSRGSGTGNYTIATSSTFTMPAYGNLTIKAPNKNSAVVTHTIYMELLFANDTVIMGDSDIATSGEAWREWTLQNPYSTEQTVKIKWSINYTVAGGYCYHGNLHITTDYNITTNTSFRVYLGYSNKLISAYNFRNSTAVISTVAMSAYWKAIGEYMSAFKTQITTAMTAAQAYHSYLRGLGYTDYTQIPTLIPTPDLLMPPTNSTFWSGVNMQSPEWYAILAAYLQSLYNLFQNETLGRQIQNVTFADINFTSAPVYCTGRFYDASNTSWTAYCSSIWIAPLSGSITLLAGQNITLGVAAQVVYQLNSTRAICYVMGASNDIVEVEKIYVRQTNGSYTNPSTATITMNTLDYYAIEYIVGYEPPDTETGTEWNYSGLTATLITVVMIASVIGGLIDRTNKRRR